MIESAKKEKKGDSVQYNKNRKMIILQQKNYFSNASIHTLKDVSYLPFSLFTLLLSSKQKKKGDGESCII